MKILIANLKGGSGKTTLSIHLANYIHYFRNRQVSLVTLQPMAGLADMARVQQAPYPVLEKSISEVVNIKYADFCVIDAGYPLLIKDLATLAATCNVLVVPFQYHLLDFQLLRVFLLALKPLSQVQKKLALPNCIVHFQYLRSVDHTHDFLSVNGFTLLPPVISSKFISSISFNAPGRQTLALYRAPFNQIV